MKNFTSLEQLKAKALTNPETKACYDELKNEFSAIDSQIKKGSLNDLISKPPKDL